MMVRHLGFLRAICAALTLAACTKKADMGDGSETGAEPLPIAGETSYKPDAVTEARSHPPAKAQLVIPGFNPRRGRILFTTKGCVICHQVNGVGGTVAPALDAPPGEIKVNPVEFSARMWKGAPAMTALQETELGYVIDLDGKDIADLAAFAASPEEQSLLTLESVPAPLRDWFISTRYWEDDEWTEYKSRGARIPDLDQSEVSPKP